MKRVDLHNHILCDLDDGCANEAESLELARLLVDAGYTDIAVTPHSRADFDPTDALCELRRTTLQATLEREGVPLRLHPGREHHLTPEFLERVVAQTARTLANGPYVLVELPFAGAVPNLRDVLFRVQLAGLRPIIAHPERCAHFVSRPDNAEALFDAGIAFQLEVGSLAGIYGSPAKKTAQALIDRGLVSIAATDAHHPKSAALILTKGLKALEKSVGASKLALWTEENPGRVLRGEALRAF